MIFLKLVIRKLISRATLFLLFAFSWHNIHAQSEHPYGLWLGYQLRKPVGKKFSWNNDLQLRFSNQKAAYDYTLIRTSLQYELNKNFSTTAGALYGLDNYEAKSTPIWMNEKRLFQQCLFTAGSLEKVQLQLTFRLEERWFDVRTKQETDTGTYSWRFRHRIELKRSLGEKWRVMAGDEYMLQHSNGKSSFNQNRVWAGAGRIFNRNELQVQLMQIIWKAPDATVLRISFIHQLHS
jgi:hypothetical protein